MLTLPYPERKAEVMAFVRKHHYSRRCPGVWSMAYGLENAKGKLQAVAVYGPPPYPSVARAFCRRREDIPHMAWQTRMVGAGISSAELDGLLRQANADLAQRGFWWVLTLTDPTSWVIDGSLRRLISPGYTGETYHRNGFMFLGYSGTRGREGWLVDGHLVHIRQGAVTLSRRNIRQHFPEARVIREIFGSAKQRWVYVLGTAAERAQRILLMRYHIQDWEATTQQRLLALLKGLLPRVVEVPVINI